MPTCKECREKNKKLDVDYLCLICALRIEYNQNDEDFTAI